MKILEEFWYGNIEPTEYDTSASKEYKKLLELICKNEEKLKGTMTDEPLDARVLPALPTLPPWCTAIFFTSSISLSAGKGHCRGCLQTECVRSCRVQRTQCPDFG